MDMMGDVTYCRCDGRFYALGGGRFDLAVIIVSAGDCYLHDGL